MLTVLLGIAYPLAMIGVAQMPGLSDQADGSLVTVGRHGRSAAALIGQSFTDDDGNPLVQYFQSRPSAAGDGYDPTATSASNLGPESIVDTLPDPAVNPDDDGNAEPAHPGLRAQHGRRRAGGRRRRAGRTAPPTASARCSPCSTATA